MYDEDQPDAPEPLERVPERGARVSRLWRRRLRGFRGPCGGESCCRGWPYSTDYSLATNCKTRRAGGRAMGAHNSSSTVLQRIERLERDNRRLRVAVSAVLGILFIGILTAQARPKTRSVEAERFV